MDEQTEPSGRGTPLQHGDIAVGFGVFVRAAEVQAVGLEQQLVLGDLDAVRGVGLFHIEHMLVIHEQLVCQRKVVAVRVDPLRVKRFDNDLLADVLDDLPAG